MKTRLYRLTKTKRWTGRLEPGFSRVGRWHSGARSTIYMAESPALALLEWIKGKYGAGLLDVEITAAQLLLIEFECELREQDVFTTHLSGLPDDWWSIPNNQSTATQAVGNTWLDAREHLAMRVPSTAVPLSLTPAFDANVLLNPTHRKFPALREGGCCIEHPFDLTHYLGLPRP